MHIDSIRLKGFKRFALREQESLEQRFDQKLTMVTGPNGAGKSSLFAELSPLPADRADYHKGGFKEVEITHQGKHYTLTSSFLSGAHYSFVCDSEELNPGGTITVQRDLSAQHFGITPLVHELMTGSQSFTDMGLPARKKLFSSVTRMNMDRMIENYESLRTELKNNEYLVKTLTARMLEQQSTLMDSEWLSRKESQLTLCKAYLSHLVESRVRLLDARKDQDLSAAAQHLQHTSAQAYRFQTLHYGLLTAEGSQAHKQEEGAKLLMASVGERLRDLYGQLERAQRERDALALAANSSLDELQSQLSDKQTLCVRLRKEARFWVWEEHSPALVDAPLQWMETKLQELLQQLPENPDRALSASHYARLQERQLQTLSTQRQLVVECSQVETKLSDLKSQHRLQCPSCRHQWLPGEDGAVQETLQSRLAAIMQERAANELALKELEAQMHEQREYLALFEQVQGIYSSTKTHMLLFWKHVSDQRLLYEDPRAAAALVHSARAEWMSWVRYLEIQEEAQALQTKIDTIRSVQGASAQQVGCRIAEIEKEIEHYMSEREILTEQLARYGRVRALRGRWKEILDERESAKRRVQDASCDALLQRLISLTEDHITLARVELMECEKEISAHRLLQGAVDQLKVQIEDAQENVRALTAITEELSPKSGLIAKTVSHFLNVVIGSINQVIAGVWDYKMVLSPIDVESESLNYRFKVQVQDRLIVDDVSKVSAGMREIINLAMKVTLYKLLRLDGYPMFLDEFGVKLDATHRARVADIIFKMMASPTYSQIFLITHLDLAYGDFKDTQVLEL